MKSFLPLFLLLFGLAITGSLFGQERSFTVEGQVLDQQTGDPVEYATILVSDSSQGLQIAGTTTDDQGRFSLAVSGTNLQLEIRFIGFESIQVPIAEDATGKLSLGSLQLVATSTTLDEVVIAGETSTTEFRLDKRIFNVGKDLSSTGASALEVLNNVPSVNVNIEGAISLRGSQGVQILINGKPSVLATDEGNALGTITADMMERVEVITNPSAKYEAEGTTGIINIVLKKDERRGINGSATLNTGWPHNHSFGLSMNRRTEKFNLFTQLGAGFRELPNWIETENRNLTTGEAVLADGKEFRNENFYNVVLGTDYYLNEYNVFTLSGNFALELGDQPSELLYQSLDGNGNLIAEWARSETTEAINPKYQYEFQYKKDFRDNKEHNLLFSALGNFFGKDQSSEFFNETALGKAPFGDQRSRTDFQEARYTFQLDYTKPFTDKITIETGSQYVINDVSNDFEFQEWIEEAWVASPGLTNTFEYHQNVLGVYGTGAYEGEKWGVKGGLRLENTDLRTLLVQTGERNEQNFNNWFPSFHSSYKVSDRFSLQAGYSRRIRRPRLWDLNPFFNIRNNFSVRAGNPDLLPEFTDSYELTSIVLFKDISFNLGVYQRFTTEVIERFTTFEEGIATTTPYNIGTNRATGAEFNAKYSPTKWMSLNGDFNYLYFSRKGSFNNTPFDFASDQWFGKLTAKFKFAYDLDFEATGHYESRLITVQGEQADNLFLDLGLRKKILKGRGVINFSVRDLFASRVSIRETFQQDFYQFSRRQRGRFITMGFSYGFGKGEAMEFSGRKRF
ncbi:MAG: outer membrane beta-barrel family protein [Bacteroidota bacterium]